MEPEHGKRQKYAGAGTYYYSLGKLAESTVIKNKKAVLLFHIQVHFHRYLLYKEDNCERSFKIDIKFFCSSLHHVHPWKSKCAFTSNYYSPELGEKERELDND